jgi:hypothetical protein
MKIKLDFVTNSSSTSFVYISNEELSEELFLEAVGVDSDSPVGDLFRQMYTEINTSIQNYGKQVTTKEVADSFAGGYEFTPDVVEKMKDAINQGKNVVTSKLSSDGSLAESLLCVSMFEIESDSFYLHAFNNVW